MLTLKHLVIIIKLDYSASILNVFQTNNAQGKFWPKMVTTTTTVKQVMFLHKNILIYFYLRSLY